MGELMVGPGDRKEGRGWTDIWRSEMIKKRRRMFRFEKILM